MTDYLGSGSASGAGGGGAGGSIRIEGNTITAIGAVYAAGGTGGYWDSPHIQSGGNGGYGRVAVYFTTSFSASIYTNYLKHVGVEQSDSLFNNGFEEGDLSSWSSAQTDSGHLSVTGSARYWGYYGMQAEIADNNDLYVVDETPDSEVHYRARFYFDPNSISMAEGDEPVIFAGYASSTQVFRIQLRKDGSTYQVRICMRSDGATWYDSGWTNITDGWNALEIEWYASLNSGSMKLWVNGSEVGALDSVDNDGSALTSVRLGALGVPMGTRGTLSFDDFDSRRFSQIGLLPDPGLFVEDPSGGNTYSYDDPSHVHAVTGLSDGSEYRYDENGNMTCRIEDDQTYIQEYNAENRISEVHAVTGDCDTPGDTTSTWGFTYDGDGVKVMQVYDDYTTTLTTRYYMGGAYEVTTDGTTETTRKYYSIAGINVAMHDGTQMLYFLTDHLGSVMAVTDASGTLLDEQRYMPFGQVRTDVGEITQTDFGYTFQRNLPELGLMDYRARMYNARIGRFVQADTIVPFSIAPQTYNRFSYVLNNPITWNDPTGHVPTCKEGLRCVSFENGEVNNNSNRDIVTASATGLGEWITALVSSYPIDYEKVIWDFIYNASDPFIYGMGITKREYRHGSELAYEEPLAGENGLGYVNGDREAGDSYNDAAIDLNAIGENPEDNPMNDTLIGDEVDYLRTYTQMAANAQSPIFGPFLNKLGISSAPIWNYEPNYLYALIRHQEKFLIAVQKGLFNNIMKGFNGYYYEAWIRYTEITRSFSGSFGGD